MYSLCNKKLKINIPHSVLQHGTCRAVICGFSLNYVKCWKEILVDFLEYGILRVSLRDNTVVGNEDKDIEHSGFLVKDASCEEQKVF